MRNNIDSMLVVERRNERKVEMEAIVAILAA